VWLGVGKILEVREVRKFGRSGGLEGLGGRKFRQDPFADNKCIFATSCRLCKLSFFDSRTERFLHSVIVVLHVVQIHIKVSIYCSVVHQLRILDKNVSGTTGFGTIGTSECLGGYGDRKVLGIRKVKSFEMLGISEILKGQGCRQV
jgi:hypothetical protein